MSEAFIRIKNASQNNLKNISLELPKQQFIVITGVSGSGKSSLAFDVINKAGQTEYFSQFSVHSRRLMQKMTSPKVESIQNLSPCISLAQKTVQSNARSTVGTLTGIYDDLRMLFARLGKSPNKELQLNRSLFSFNSTTGACPNCQGLGVEDQISVDLLIEDDSKTIREGCFKITNPDGYIIYSQVTMDALQEVCMANGFSVDIPWKDLSEEQQNIVLNGSDKIKILYGKHTLESRMKWSGIKANPREKEFYKGILPVMNQILRRDRNPNILRFAQTITCSVCNGDRLQDEALSVKINQKSIAELSAWPLYQLSDFLNKTQFSASEELVAKELIASIQNKIDTLSQLGLDYLSLNRTSGSLSVGESQSIHLANQLQSNLSKVTYVFDEPSVGLHASVNKHVIKILRQLVAKGNTVIVVEHDAETIKQADWIVEIGPKAGTEGGELMFSGTYTDFLKSQHPSETRAYLKQEKGIVLKSSPTLHNEWFNLKSACINNLKTIDVSFQKNAFNVVTGVSGAGKSSLIHQTLMPLIQGQYHNQINAKGHPYLEHFDFDKTLVVDQSPIGKTARSTPATYTKVFDLIRDFYAQLPEAKAQKIKKSNFSFNTKGGRCETCEGAGKIEIGLHFMGKAESNCPSCNGQRFKEEILNIKFRNHNIADVLALSVNQALDFFRDKNSKIAHHLQVLKDIGLGYLQLGQSSNTLSGGEAQRIRLASELVKKTKGKQLFIFDEPSTGLHFVDIQTLLNVFSALIDKGHSIIVIEHNEDIITNAHHLIELGPKSGEQGGALVFEGNYSAFTKAEHSPTAKAILKPEPVIIKSKKTVKSDAFIKLKNVRTHNLKGIDVEIPHHQHTVIVGPSGSGKSSLAFETLYSEGLNAFTESFPTYVRQFTRQQNQSKLESFSGLTPSIALKQSARVKDQRSTIGTLSKVYDSLRLLYSRFGAYYCPVCDNHIKEDNCPSCGYQLTKIKSSSDLSFNHADGACPECKGLGDVLTSSSELLVANKNLALSEGALIQHKLLSSFVDPNEKYMATLLEVGKNRGFDYRLPYQQLSEEAIDIAFYGTGDTLWDVKWQFKNKTSQGEHQFKGKWIGFVGLLLDEYYRKEANSKGDELMHLLTYKTCPTCKGSRLKTESLNLKIKHKNIAEFCSLSLIENLAFLKSIEPTNLNQKLIRQLISQLENIVDFNLGYLSLDRKTPTLSGGELQRILLSQHLKGHLSDITYVLDEPSSGLHPYDIESIKQKIKQLVALGNTVVSVEHNAQVIQSADYKVALGPKAGHLGGELIYQGPNSQIENINTEALSVFELNRPQETSYFSVKGAYVNNLQDIDVDFLSQGFNVLTGVSGSGKTSLAEAVIYKSLNKATLCKSRENFEQFNTIVWLDRHSIQGSSLSSLASYFGILDDIKKVMTPLLKDTGIKAAHLSYNNKTGQCSECKGHGYIKVKMDFLNDVKSTCESCNGQRYNNSILAIKWQNKNMADMLNLSITEALSFFNEQKHICKKLHLLEQLGLGYLKLGQTTDGLSGGEAQRLKIASILLSKQEDKNLYIFDEASRGLSANDLGYLLQTFNLLLKQGHSIIAIEHHPSIIAKAQHVVDLHQGKKVYQGDISGLKGCKESLTCKYL
jgi:excinuclease ABC subunit A